MLSDEIRARLSLLHSPAAARPPHVADSRTVPAARAWLEQAQECENASGKHLRFRRPLAEIWPADSSAGYGIEGRAAWPAAPAHPELAAVADQFPRHTMFLDLETCGFAGSSVFLAGLVWQIDGALVIDQLFARHYAEERALLETLWQVAGENRVLVTFNGKSFDWPMVQDRSTRHLLGVESPGSYQATRAGRENLGRHDIRPQLTHCDMLHHARRRWKRRLPNCKLQTLERYICKRRRRDDLDGSLVPAAYHEFVRGGDTRKVGAILHHNALDLATLVQVTLRLLNG